MPSRGSFALLSLLAVIYSACPCFAITDAECVGFLVTQVQAKANVNFALPVRGQPYEDALVEPICNQHSMILQIFNETMLKLPDCSRVLSAPQGMFQIWPQCASRCESAFVTEWAKTLPAFVGVTASASHNYDAALTAPVCENSGIISTGLETIRKQLDCKIFVRIASSRWEQKCGGRCKELLKNDLVSTGTDVSVLFGDARWTEKGLAKTCALSSEISASRTKLVTGTNSECGKHLEFFTPPASECEIYNCRTSLFESWADAFPSLGKAEDLWDLEFNSEQRNMLCDSKDKALESIKTIVGEKQECEIGFYVKERLRIDSLSCLNCVDCLVDITTALSNNAPSKCDEVHSIADKLDKCHPVCSGKPEPSHKTHVKTVLELAEVPNCDGSKLDTAAAKYDVIVAANGDGDEGSGGGGGGGDIDEPRLDGFDFTEPVFLAGTIAGVSGLAVGAVLLRRYSSKSRSPTESRVERLSQKPVVAYGRRPQSSANPRYSTPDML